MVCTSLSLLGWLGNTLLHLPVSYNTFWSCWRLWKSWSSRLRFYKWKWLSCLCVPISSLSKCASCQLKHCSICSVGVIVIYHFSFNLTFSKSIYSIVVRFPSRMWLHVNVAFIIYGNCWIPILALTNHVNITITALPNLPPPTPTYNSYLVWIPLFPLSPSLH